MALALYLRHFVVCVEAVGKTALLVGWRLKTTMSTLDKKTKAQLAEIADELDLDHAGCKVKKHYVELLTDYFNSNFQDMDADHKYYDLAAVTVPTAVVIGSEEDDEDEDEESSEAVEDILAGAEDEDDEEEEEDDDEDDDDDLDFECYTSFTKALKAGTLPEYLELKNFELKDYLGDPYSINDITFFIETSVLLFNLVQFTSLSSYVSDHGNKYLAAVLAKIPTIDVGCLNISNASILSLWYLSAKALPCIFSYYVNFTYDFERDAFIEALAKLFLAVVIFQTDVNIPSVKDELKYTFGLGNVGIQTFKHLLYTSTVSLRAIFGNWILLDAVFISVLALYANLAFV